MTGVREERGQWEPVEAAQLSAAWALLGREALRRFTLALSFGGQETFLNFLHSFSEVGAHSSNFLF